MTYVTRTVVDKKTPPGHRPQTMTRKIHVVTSTKFIVGTAILLMGCNNGEHTILTCRWLGEEGEELEAKFCYQVGGTCKNYYPDDKEFCAWNVFSSEEPSDINKFVHVVGQYPNAFHADEKGKKGSWSPNSCFNDVDVQASKAYPPSNTPKSSCNDDYEPPNGTSQSSPTSLSTPTTGLPTTGDLTTGLTDVTTSSGATEATGETGSTGGEEKQYLCSRQSPWKCANLSPDDALSDDMHEDPYTDAMQATHTLWDDCWVEINSPSLNKLSKCTTALTPEAAETTCQNDCNQYKMMMEALCADDTNCALVTSIDCDFDGVYVNSAGISVSVDAAEEEPILTPVSGWECDGEDLKLGTGPYLPFEASASLLTPQGDVAGVSNLHGYLGYKVPACTPLMATCDIHIDTLVLLSSTATGGYTDSNGAGGVFEIEGMGLQLTQPLAGTWYVNRQSAVFPSDALSGEAWAKSMSIDGLPVTIGYSMFTFEVDHTVGSLDFFGSGALELNLFFTLPVSGTVMMSIQTL